MCAKCEKSDVWENVRVVLEKVRSMKIIEMYRKQWEKEGMREV